MLGLSADAIVGNAAHCLFTGNDQLLIQLASPELVHGAKPIASQLFALSSNADGQPKTYIFAETKTGFVSRFFWRQNGSLMEDPGTGSACANLGGYLNAEGRPAPSVARIEQGHSVGGSTFFICGEMSTATCLWVAR
jgi:predicted PhzF superfamily epimerase YddE/YHI9